MTFQAPRDDLIRAIFRAEPATNDEGVLVGYPIVFNEWTELDSWEGRFRERIAPGAVNKTLKERGDRVKVLFNHGMDPQIGDKPLGRPRALKPDDVGLWTETPLDDTSYNADIAALLRSGTLDGMSFRFSVVRETWDEADGLLPERTIHELKLYEFGPVTFPAYEATSAGIRSREGFALWLSTPPAQRAALRAALAAGTTPDLSVAAHSGTTDSSTPDAPPLGTRRTLRHEVLAQIEDFNARAKGRSA